MIEKLRVSFITNIPTPYRIWQLEHVKRRFYNLKVYFTDDVREERRYWEINKSQIDYFYYLPLIFSTQKYGSFNRKVLNIVLNSDIIILGGYDQPTYVMIAFLCKVFNKPYILLLDGIAPSRIKNLEENNRQNIKFKLKKVIVNSASAFWVNGKVSKLYLQKIFQIDEKKIFNQYLPIYEKPFLENIVNKLKIRKEMRRIYKIKENEKVILYSGRFLKRKRFDDIVKALSLLKNKNSYHILAIGDFPDRRLMNLNKNINLNYIGFVKPEHLYKYYFMSDMLILPSEDEPWGLVVNEAIFSDLPVISSDDCGSSLDLVKNGKNGFIYKTGDIGELAKCVKDISNLNYDQVKIINRELKKIWNVRNSVRSLERAIKYVFEKK